MSKLNEVTVQLEHPVQLADSLLTQVTLRRPTMGDILDFPIAGERDFAGEMALLATLCNLKIEEVRHMDMDDYSRLQGVFASFRSQSPR